MTDEEIIEIASEFRAGILDGRPSRMMCAAICWPLEGLLRMRGLECNSEEVELGECNHVFLRLPDGRVLDPTADQFNYRNDKWPPVYLGAPTRLHTSIG